MAAAVAETIENGGTLIAEAGTGTGKTLAYLVPAILSGQRALISTGTKNLQEQIFFKDLPALREALGVPFTATLMKGRSNYLCLHRFGVANAYTNLGILGYMQGHWVEAADNFERSDTLRREIGYTTGRAANLQNLGLQRLAMGDHAQARHHLESSLAISQQLGEEYDSVHAEIGLAQLAQLQGRLDEATQHVQAALARREAATPDELVQAGWIWALIQTERGELDAGLEAVAHALQTARGAGLTESEADCLRVLGLLHARAGRGPESEEQLRASAALAHAQGDRYRQGLALLELGRTYQRWPAVLMP
jgi:tetratricopeptide (TPR) repeat protein